MIYEHKRVVEEQCNNGIQRPMGPGDKGDNRRLPTMHFDNFRATH